MNNIFKGGEGMISRILLSILLTVGLAGCATMRKDAAVTEQLEMRISDLEQKVQEKDDQIQALEARLAETRREAEMKVVKRASGKASTREIQSALKNAGYYTGNVDGKVGKLTKSAVMEFQKANGLKADGVVGQQTWAKLSEHLE